MPGALILWRMLGIALLAVAAFGAAFGIGRVSREPARELHVALPRTTPAPTAVSSVTPRRQRATRKVRRVRRHRAPARRVTRPAAAPAPRPMVAVAPPAPPPAAAPATPPTPDPKPAQPAPRPTPAADGQVFFDDTN